MGSALALVLNRASRGRDVDMLHHLPFWLRFSVSVLPLPAISSVILAVRCDASVSTALGLAYGCIAMTELVYLAWLFAFHGKAAPSLTQSHS